MHVFKAAFYFTTSIYVLFYQPWLLYCFLGFIAIYCLAGYLYPRAQSLSTRRKFTLATWDPPSDGIIYNNIKVCIDPLLQLLQTYPTQHKPTLTHFVIRACGEILKESPDLNGKLIFGKFIPYQTCDVSCLVNVDGVHDVGMLLIKDVPSKSIAEIEQEIKHRAKSLKPKGGDHTHKKRMKLLDMLPSFLIRLIYETSIFLSSVVGLTIPGMGLQRDPVGSMIVSSVGTFGYTDAYTSFFGTIGQWILLTVNAAQQETVIRGGKIEIATMMNVNCVIDHRYLYSGARGQKLVDIFHRVFNNPELYLEGERSKRE